MNFYSPNFRLAIIMAEVLPTVYVGIRMMLL